MQEIKTALKRLAKDELGLDISPELTPTDQQFGDYSTNLAMKAAAQLGKNPRELSILLAGKLYSEPSLAKIEVAGPGFINLTLKDKNLYRAAMDAINLPKKLNGQKVVIEHTDPNPFKQFHIGHAYSNCVGTSIGKLLGAGGAKVHQVSYHGDVGLHIAMALYGLTNGQGQTSLGAAYAFGADKYYTDAAAKQEIIKINVALYSGEDDGLNKLYNKGRAQSLAEFEKIYRKIGSKFEKSYFESDTASEGLEIVNKNIGSTFQKSEGAVIFDGEKHGLHKRVFITKQGLPTYEAKEIGLAFAKQRDYPDANSFIVITANEIDDYFKVLIAAIKQIDKPLGDKICHLSHGLVKFPEGKMSSRSGKVETFENLVNSLQEKIKKTHEQTKHPEQIAIAAMKYEFLKHRIGSDFIFDINESINLRGNSGPYLLYAHARARAILQKAGKPLTSEAESLEPAERSLARAVSQFPDVVSSATDNLMPSDITTYLYALAQQFNSFYESSKVIGDSRQNIRLGLVKAYADVLKLGLELLNIQALGKV